MKLWNNCYQAIVSILLETTPKSESVRWALPELEIENFTIVCMSAQPHPDFGFNLQSLSAALALCSLVVFISDIFDVCVWQKRRAEARSPLVMGQPNIKTTTMA